MLAKIIVDFNGINKSELSAVLQGLRNVEQENSSRITMFIEIQAMELKTEQLVELLRNLTPPLEYMQVLDRFSIRASNQYISEKI